MGEKEDTDRVMQGTNALLVTDNKLPVQFVTECVCSHVP